MLKGKGSARVLIDTSMIITKNCLYDKGFSSNCEDPFEVHSFFVCIHVVVMSMSVLPGLEGMILHLALVYLFLSYGFGLGIHAVQLLLVTLSQFHVVYKRVGLD